jgi:ATP-dependent Clp protease ATP-binding subunit ClpC
MDEAGAATIINVKPNSIVIRRKKKWDNWKEKEVVLKQKYEEAAKLRDEERQVDETLAKELTDWNTKLDVTEIGVGGITEIVSMMTGIPIKYQLKKVNVY